MEASGQSGSTAPQAATTPEFVAAHEATAPMTAVASEEGVAREATEAPTEEPRKRQKTKTTSHDTTSGDDADAEADTEALTEADADAGTDAHAVDADADADSSDADVARCPNFLVCAAVVPQWVLGHHGGSCGSCAVQRLGRLAFVDVDQHESCPICLEDGPAKHVKLDCNHTVCVACFRRPWERSPQPSLQEFGCPPYPQGTGPEDQDPTTGDYIWDGIEESWRASNSSEAEEYDKAVRCTYTDPNGSYPVLRMTLDALQLDALDEEDARRARKREQALSKCPLCREPTPWK